MTNDKPREWWLHLNSGTIYENPVNRETKIHVIDKSAYDAAIEGKENWYKLCIEKDKRMAVYLRERDEARAEIEKMRQAGVREINRINFEKRQDDLVWSASLSEAKAEADSLRLMAERQNELATKYADALTAIADTPSISSNPDIEPNWPRWVSWAKDKAREALGEK